MFKFLNKGISTLLAIGIILILVILVGGYTVWQYSEIKKEESEVPEIQTPEREEVINNFEECIAKGYPILESYPRQCKTPEGETFIEEIEVKDEIADWKICSADTDCVKVDADCCGCNAGGKAVAVNKNYKEEWEKELLEKCKDIVCPAVMSEDPSCFGAVKCVNNVCQIESKNKNSNLEFSIGQCNSNIDPYSPPIEKILSQEWLDDGTLLVEAYLKTYCAGAKISGDYELKDINLILKYKVTISGPVTTCVCPHGLTYKISNLEKKDYQISLIKEE